MPNAILKRFTIEGRGPLPFDLLRADQCWPASSRDAAQIPAADPIASRSLTLETAAKYAPNRRAWALAGWKVVD